MPSRRSSARFVPGVELKPSSIQYGVDERPPIGISVGSATLFDHAGPFGTGMVTAIANPAAQIDFGDPA